MRNFNINKFEETLNNNSNNLQTKWKGMDNDTFLEGFVDDLLKDNPYQHFERLYMNDVVLSNFENGIEDDNNFTNPTNFDVLVKVLENGVYEEVENNSMVDENDDNDIENYEMEVEKMEVLLEIVKSTK